MKKLHGFTMAAAALTAFAGSTAFADDKCDNVGAPASVRAELSKPCAQQVVQDGTTDATSDAGSAGAEPGYAREAPVDTGAGYDGSGNPDPGFYVADPGESQFLMDTWTMAGG